MPRKNCDETVDILTGAPREVSRREFLQLAGTGLFIFFATDPIAALQEPSRLPGRPSYPTDLNAYLRIGGDGRVTCFVGKVELGQGSKTALAQLIAEELDISLDAVDMVMGDTNLCPWDMGTFGSLTIRHFGPILRGAAAEARAVLLQLSADYLHLPSVEDLRVKDGVVSSAQDESKRVSYARLQLLTGKGSGDHSLPGRRLWWQERVSPGSGSSTVGKTYWRTRAGGLGSGGRILL